MSVAPLLVGVFSRYISGSIGREGAKGSAGQQSPADRGPNDPNPLLQFDGTALSSRRDSLLVQTPSDAVPNVAADRCCRGARHSQDSSDGRRSWRIAIRPALTTDAEHWQSRQGSERGLA